MNLVVFFGESEFCTAEALEPISSCAPVWIALRGTGKHTTAAEMEEVRIRGLHRLQVRDEKGDRCAATLEIKYRRIRVLPPIGKHNEYPELLLTVIHAQERGTPHGREKVDWKLITNLPVRSRAEAIEKLEWYSMRWKIETFHKILKSGCKAEESKLRTAQRLTNLIAVFCILGWRVFWFTMMNRSLPCCISHPGFHGSGNPSARPIGERQGTRQSQASLSAYLLKLAQLGGATCRVPETHHQEIV